MTIRILASIALLLELLVQTSGDALAQSGTAQIGELIISDGWARASIGTSRPAAAFLTITNRGSTPQVLVTVTSVAAKKATVHRTASENGVIRMKPALPVIIPPNQATILRPGGLHIMLFELKKPLKKGEMLTLRLDFQDLGEVQATVPVLGPGARGP